MRFLQKLSYLVRSIANAGQARQCPYCKATRFSILDTKYFFTLLLKCDRCGLSHRHPKDDKAWLDNFYQRAYNIENHMMTKLPSDQDLAVLKENNFATLRRYDKYIDALFPGPAAILDYGCSWGYTVFQLVRSGHKAVGYELSVPRAEFGRRELGVTIHHNPENLPATFDLILSSHVIEHLHNIEEFIQFSRSHVTEEGVFMAFCPNGGTAYRSREPHIWHVNWGLLHPNYLDVQFAKHIFKDNPYLILTDDWVFDEGTIDNWDGKSQQVGTKLDGKELLIIAKPNIRIQ